MFIETQIIQSFVSLVSIYTKAYRAPLEGYNACLNGKKMDSLVFQDVVYTFNILYFFIHTLTHFTFMKHKDTMKIGIKKTIKSQDCEVRLCQPLY